MNPQKVLLYYGFTPINDPVAVQLWQKNLCETLNLKGRILISPTGINGTVGGDIDDLRKYVKNTKKYPGFKKIAFKWSQGTGDEFPRLYVAVKNELVAFDNSEEIKVNESGVIGGGTHLRPEQVHELVEAHGDEVVFFDGRNQFEAKIGKFKNAIVPDVDTSRDFVREIESGKYDHLKDKPVVTYCTGGIRCEILSVVMKNRGFKEVYQMVASLNTVRSLVMMVFGKVRSIPLILVWRSISQQRPRSSANARSANHQARYSAIAAPRLATS
jgi:UPF0176 protein